MTRSTEEEERARPEKVVLPEATKDSNSRNGEWSTLAMPLRGYVRYKTNKQNTSWICQLKSTMIRPSRRKRSVSLRDHLKLSSQKEETNQN